METVPAAAGFTERHYAELFEGPALAALHHHLGERQPRPVDDEAVAQMLSGRLVNEAHRDAVMRRLIEDPDLYAVFRMVADGILEYEAETGDLATHASVTLGDGAYADLTGSGAWMVSDEDACVELSVRAIRRLATAAGVLPGPRPWSAPAVTPLAVPEGYVGGVCRRVHHDGSITFRSTRLTLPAELAGQTVLVFYRPDLSSCCAVDNAGVVRFA